MFSYATLYENGVKWRRENLHEGYRYAAATNQFSNRCGTLTTPTPVFLLSFGANIGDIIACAPFIFLCHITTLHFTYLPLVRYNLQIPAFI